MKIHTNIQEGAHIISVEGEVDFHSSPKLREALMQLTDKKAKQIIVQLKKVGYMDSSGVATFVEAFQKIENYQGSLVLTELNDTVRGVFEIAKLDSIFDIAETLDDALGKAKGIHD